MSVSILEDDETARINSSWISGKIELLEKNSKFVNVPPFLSQEARKAKYFFEATESGSGQRDRAALRP
jgi:hypothetical protein